MRRKQSDTACFSGYRPGKFSYVLKNGNEAYLALRERIGQAISQALADGYTGFMVGMADGFDLTAGSVLLELKDKQPEKADVNLVAVLPFEGHRVSELWRGLHQLVLERADEVITLASKYHPRAYHDRNRYMVDHSSRLICYYDGIKGGTEYTVKYAERKGLTIVNVAELKPE